MLVIILLSITLKYSNLCTFSWFLVNLLLLMKTAQLTVRGLLNRPPPRFSLREPPRARFIPGSHDFPVDVGFPGLLLHFCLLELNWPGINSCCSPLMPSNHFKPVRHASKGKGKGEKGTCPPFCAFLPLPSPPLACFAPVTQFNLFKKQKCVEPYGKKNSCAKFLNSILYICEANYQTEQTPRGLPLNYSTCIITSSVPQLP